MELPDLPGDIVAKMDQAQQSLQMHAIMLSDYYAVLTKNGTPPELAYRLCLDLQKYMLPGRRAK